MCNVDKCYEENLYLLKLKIHCANTIVLTLCEKHYYQYKDMTYNAVFIEGCEIADLSD